MITDHTPLISVVIVTPDRFQTIRKTVQHLHAQTVRDRLELVIVAPLEDAVDLDAEALEGFAGVHVVGAGAIASIAAAKAAGIRRAKAPVVALTEGHSFPDPGWAEALIEAHHQPWAAVGPVIENANPGTVVSWANLLIEYGSWVAPAVAGLVEHLPGQNGAYKQAVLLGYGEDLAFLLEAETVLHWDLRARGYQLYLEPAAKTFHVNISLPLPFMQVSFHTGRIFAATRAGYQRWPRLRRLVYSLLQPVVVVIRLRRILRQLSRADHPSDLFPRILPALIIGLSLSAAGEMMGYTFGAGSSPTKMKVLEFDRYQTLAKQDRKEIAF